MQSMFATAMLILALGAAGGAVAAGSPWDTGPQHLAASPYAKVRVAAALALADDADRASLAGLRRLSADRHVAVRMAAVHALARRGVESGVRRSLSDPSPSVRRLARRLLRAR